MTIKIKILIVDDHQIVREGIRKILAEESDMELLGSVSSGEDALDFMKEYQPDIVVADLSMPDMSGIELTEHISRDFPSVKVLILSMFTDEDYIFNAIRAGAKGYLPKQDSSTDILVEAIRNIYHGEEYYSPSISKIVMKSFAKNAKTAGSPEFTKNNQMTAREKEILKLFAMGFTNNEIADALCISVHTVKTHKNNIMLKYNFKCTVEMIKYALRNKIVEL